METFDEIRSQWNESKGKAAGVMTLDPESVGRIIQLRLKKEKKAVMEYFVASFAWQLLIYSFGSFLIARFGRDTQVLAGSLSVVILYLPFTVIFMRKFKAMCIPAINRTESVRLTIEGSLKNQYAMLSGFFRFKKWFDAVGVPVTCSVIVIILFRIYVPGGIDQHPAGAGMTLGFALLCFAAAIYHENKKHFIKPLKRLGDLMKEL